MATEMTARRVLLVADWSVDPHAVVAAASERAERERVAFRLMVPAWLHGLDWAGDPRASIPCAQRQLSRLIALCAGAGLDVEIAAVGDPDPVSAVCDSVDEWGADDIVLCTHRHWITARRVRRATGLWVRHVDVPALEARRRSGHCVPEQAA